MKQNLINQFQKHCITPKLVPFYTHLFKLSLRGMGVLNSEGSNITGESWLMKTIQKQFPVKTIVDVGANTGGYTAELLTYFPSASVYCFEPNPETYQLLLKNHHKRKNVHAYNLAASNRNGAFNLYDFADNAPLKSTQPTATMASAYKEVIENFHRQPSKVYRLRSITLDTWAKQTKIASVDWLKIDTEGHELQVLMGAKRMLSEHKIKLIQFEFNDMHAYSHTFMLDIINLLKNYTLYRLLPNGWYSLRDYRPLTHELFGFQNIVAIEG